MKTKETPLHRAPDSVRHFIKPFAASLGVLATTLAASASSDYGPAIWNPACNGHWYTSGYGHRFHVIHDMEGYYLSTISYFQNCATSASVHYCVNGVQDTGTDHPAGEITQMVLEAYYAWHVLCWNQYCTGTEHEGFASNPAWYTEAMYQASVGITRHEADKFGFAKDRNHIVGHNEKSSAAWVAWAGPNLGINATCNSHTDPGPYWDWSHYMYFASGFDICRKGTMDPVTLKGYEIEGYGGIHPINGAPVASGYAYWSGWDIVNDIAMVDYTTPKGYTLDGWGGVHPFGGAPSLPGWPYWNGWDIARALKIDPATLKGYTLDGYGGVNAFNGAVAPNPGAAYFGWDIARDIAVTSWSTGSGYTMDGWGGVHPFGSAPTATGYAYWPNWDIARAMKVDPATNKGYTLDGFGGVHPFNGAPVVSGGAYWPGNAIARDLVVIDFNAGKGYVIDGYGGWWPFGGAPAVTGAPHYQ